MYWSKVAEVWMYSLSLSLQLASGFSIIEANDDEPMLAQDASSPGDFTRDFAVNLQLAGYLQKTFPHFIDQLNLLNDLNLGSEEEEDDDENINNDPTNFATSSGLSAASLAPPENNGNNPAKISLWAVPSKRQQGWFTRYGKRSAGVSLEQVKPSVKSQDSVGRQWLVRGIVWPKKPRLESGVPAYFMPKDMDRQVSSIPFKFVSKKDVGQPMQGRMRKSGSAHQAWEVQYGKRSKNRD